MDEQQTRRVLIVYWDPATNEVELDGQGLSVFDQAGMLACALEIAGAELPSLAYAFEVEDDE